MVHRLAGESEADSPREPSAKELEAINQRTCSACGQVKKPKEVDIKQDNGTTFVVCKQICGKYRVKSPEHYRVPPTKK